MTEKAYPPLYLDDGTACEVTNMFDEYGEDTNDMDEAVVVVAQHPDGHWITQEVGPEDRVTIH